MKTCIVTLLLLLSQYALSNTATETYIETSKNAHQITLNMCLSLELTDQEVYQIIKNGPYAYKLNSSRDQDTFFIMGYWASIKNGKKWKHEFELAWASFTHVFTVMDDYNYIKNYNFKIAPELLGLLESEGYLKALNECFGSDAHKKNLFTIDLLMAHGLGQFISIYGPAKTVTSGLNSLKATAVGLRYGRQIALTEKTLRVLAVGGPIALAMYVQFLKHKLNKLVDVIQRDITDPCRSTLPSNFDTHQFSEAEQKLRADIDTLLTQVNKLMNENLNSVEYQQLSKELSKKQKLIQNLTEKRQARRQVCQPPIN